MFRRWLTGVWFFAALFVLLPAAHTADFNDAANGNWTTASDPGHGAADVWGAGTGSLGDHGTAGVNYPHAGDTATIDSHTVIFNIDIPATVSITLAGGTLVGHRKDLTLRRINAPINVTAPSSLNGNVPITESTGGAYNTLVGNISGTGKLSLLNNAQRIELETTDNSNFSGGWNLNNSELAFHWHGNSVGTGSQVLGTGAVESNGGIVRFYQNVGTLLNSFIVNSGGLTIHANTGGGVGPGSVNLGGVISGEGTLILQAQSSGTNKTVLSNPNNSVAAMTKNSAGLAEFTTPGALPADLFTVTGGIADLNTTAGVWNTPGMDLVITGGALEFDSVVTELVVHGLTVNGTSFLPGSYDITQTHSSVNFTTYFNGAGVVTVVPEPSTLALAVLAFVGFGWSCRRPRR